MGLKEILWHQILSESISDVPGAGACSTPPLRKASEASTPGTKGLISSGEAQ